MDPHDSVIFSQEFTCPWHYRLPPAIPAAPIRRATASDPRSLLPIERDILRYSFRHLGLLEEALTHPSCPGSAPHYQRLEFLGDSALGLAVTNHLYEAYPGLDPGRLSRLRAANVCTEKLARAAVLSGLYRFLRHNAASLDDRVRDFAEAVKGEEKTAIHGGFVKAPKVLADIVDSVAAAIYVDVGLNLKRLWLASFGAARDLDELRDQPQPVSMLYELCQKKGETVKIRNLRKGQKDVASVYIDGRFIASVSSEHREIAKLEAASLALAKLADHKPKMGAPEAREKKKMCHGKTDLVLSVVAVEKILGYKFRTMRLLEEALTHLSYDEDLSYERLEFVGDALLGLVVSIYIYSTYPEAGQGQLSRVRAANVSTEKLARVALNHRLYRFLRHNIDTLDDMVREFAKSVEEDGESVIYGVSVKAPKVLADMTESVAAAIYVDIGFDLQCLWMVFRGLLEPIVTLEDLQHQPQPVTRLYDLCQKKGNTVYIAYWKKDNRCISSVYVGGKFVASGSSEKKDTAKLKAAKAALMKLSELEPSNGRTMEVPDWMNGPFEIKRAKQKLHGLCGKKKWPKPDYSNEKETGPAHMKKFICSVKISTSDGVLSMEGEEKTRIRDAQNSAASLMIRAIHEELNLL